MRFDDGSSVSVPLDLEERHAQLIEILETISGTVTPCPTKRYGRTNRTLESGQSFSVPTDILARHAQLVKALENIPAGGGAGGGLLATEVASAGAVTATGEYHFDGAHLHLWLDGAVKRIAILS